jgi:hypothetical protein
MNRIYPEVAGALAQTRGNSLSPGIRPDTQDQPGWLVIKEAHQRTENRQTKVSLSPEVGRIVEKAADGCLLAQEDIRNDLTVPPAPEN